MKILLILLLFLSCSGNIQRVSGIVETWNGSLYEFSQAELEISGKITIDKKNGESIVIKKRQVKIIRIMHEWEKIK